MFEGITNKGSEYLAKCQASGVGIKLAKVKIGDGRIVEKEDPATFSDIKSIKQEVEISEKSQTENVLKLAIEFNNAGVKNGYFPREIGIYAQDGNTEILYWYINDGDQTSWMPPAEKAPIKFKYTVNIMATNNETTIVNWTGKEFWVDKEFLKNNTAKIKFKNKGQDVKEYSILGENIEVDLDTTDIIGTINNEATLNQAKGNGWYKVDNHWINNMYGYGFLYAYTHEQTTQQIFFSHRGGIAWRQDWNSNISAATWQKIGADADEVIAKIMGITYGGVLNNSNQKEKGKCYYDTANKKIFKCIENTTVNNANAEYFYPISNNDISELQRKCLTSEVVYRCYEYKAQSGKKLQFDESRANRMLQAGWAAFLRVAISWGGYQTPNLTYIINTPDHSQGSYDPKFEYNGTTCTITFLTHDSMRVTFEGKNANTSWVSLVEIISRVDMDGTQIGDIGSITEA